MSTLLQNVIVYPISIVIRDPLLKITIQRFTPTPKLLPVIGILALAVPPVTPLRSPMLNLFPEVLHQLLNGMVVVGFGVRGFRGYPRTGAFRGRTK